eukprot:g1712.t1
MKLFFKIILFVGLNPLQPVTSVLNKSPFCSTFDVNTQGIISSLTPAIDGESACDACLRLLEDIRTTVKDEKAPRKVIDTMKTKAQEKGAGAKGELQEAIREHLDETLNHLDKLVGETETGGLLEFVTYVMCGKPREICAIFGAEGRKCQCPENLAIPSVVNHLKKSIRDAVKTTPKDPPFGLFRFANKVRRMRSRRAAVRIPGQCDPPPPPSPPSPDPHEALEAAAARIDARGHGPVVHFDFQTLHRDHYTIIKENNGAIVITMQIDGGGEVLLKSPESEGHFLHELMMTTRVQTLEGALVAKFHEPPTMNGKMPSGEVKPFLVFEKYPSLPNGKMPDFHNFCLAAFDALSQGQPMWGITNVGELAEVMLAVLRDVARTLHVVHKNLGITHFDIKSDNIIVVHRGEGPIQGLVADWGGAIPFNANGKAVTRRGPGGYRLEYSRVNMLDYRSHVKKVPFEALSKVFRKHAHTKGWFLETLAAQGDGGGSISLAEAKMFAPFSRADTFGLMVLASRCCEMLERLRVGEDNAAYARMSNFQEKLHLNGLSLRSGAWSCNEEYQGLDARGPNSAEDEDRKIHALLNQPDIIGEEDLINMVRESQGREKTAAAAAAPASNTNMTMPSGGGAAKGRSSSSGEVSYKMTNVRGAKAAVTKRESDSRHVLWSVKHRPKIPKDLIGNSQNILRLTNWLKNWSRKYNTSSSSSKSGGKKKKRPKMNAAQLKSFNAQRGAILSGPPGIGKTSAASLVAKHLGFEVVEFNASDKRSKGVMHTLSEAVNSRVMTFGGGSKRNATTSSRGRVVIMDEVDGMSSGDRGGAAALADVIRTSRSPVICICNDLQKKSLSSLRSVCLGLPFRRPNRASIAKRMQAVARSEGLLIEDSAMEALVEGVGNDIRQVLNALQMMSRRHVGGGGKGGGQQQQPVRYSEMKTRLQAISKDSILRMTAFTGAQEIFNTRSAPLNKRYESFFVDYSLIPLMVQENYPSVLANARGSDQSEKVERMCRAAEAVANSDMLSASTGGTMNWSLLKYQAALNVEAAFHANGFCGQVNFPAWFGKYSKRNGRRRLLRELSTHMSGSGVSASCGPNALRLDNYMHALRAALMSPLIAKGQDGIEAALEGLRVYGLSREDLMEKMPEFEIQIGRPSGSARTPPPFQFLDPEAGVNKDKVKLFKKNTGKGKKKKRKSGSGKKGGGSKRKR